jgi:translocation and assembly module TamA
VPVCADTAVPTTRAKLPAFLTFLSILALPLAATAQQPSLEIEGAEDVLAANIRAHVNLPDLECSSSTLRLSRFLPGIRQSVVRAGRALGYYQLRQSSRFESVDDCWQLRVQVEPGEPVRVDQIDISIDSNSELFQSVLEDLPLRSGEQLNQSAYEQIKTDLSAVAVEHGFFDARYNRSELQMDLVENSADVLLEFSPGPRYQIGAIRIEEIDALSSDFVARFFGIETGDNYSSEAVLGIRNSLNSSHYFSSVSVTPQISQAVDRQVPIQIGLSMRPKIMYAVGIGVTTDIGPRLRLDYENRYLNRRGHSWQGNVGLSPVQQNLDLSYRIPLRNPATESLEFSTGYLAEDTDTFNSNSSKMVATYSFINNWQWRQQLFLGYQHDESDISGETVVADFVIPGISLDRTRADDALYPARGWRLFGELKGASDTLLSSENFIQLNLSGKAIESFANSRLLFRFDLGTTVTDNIDELPTSIRYFTGGDQSVRGYKYESLGPENEAGEVVGGKHTIALSLEADFPIAKNWKLAVFADTGNAFNDFTDFEFKTGAGVGLRWLSPIGPIRVDLASALDLDNELRLHITMGPDL